MNRQAEVYATWHLGFRFIWCLFDPFHLDRVWKHILLWLLDVFPHFSTHQSFWLTACLPRASTVAAVYLKSNICMLRHSYRSSQRTGTLWPRQHWDGCKMAPDWAGGSCVRKLVHSRPDDCVFVWIGRDSQMGPDGWLDGWKPTEAVWAGEGWKERRKLMEN